MIGLHDCPPLDGDTIPPLCRQVISRESTRLDSIEQCVIRLAETQERHTDALAGLAGIRDDVAALRELAEGYKAVRSGYLGIRWLGGELGMWAKILAGIAVGWAALSGKAAGVWGALAEYAKARGWL